MRDKPATDVTRSMVDGWVIVANLRQKEVKNGGFVFEGGKVKIYS